MSHRRWLSSLAHPNGVARRGVREGQWGAHPPSPTQIGRRLPRTRILDWRVGGPQRRQGSAEGLATKLALQLQLGNKRWGTTPAFGLAGKSLPQVRTLCGWRLPDLFVGTKV